MITAFNAEITAMEQQVKQCFGQARDAEIYLSQPGLGQVLAARALGEFGDDQHRYAKSRKNYASTSPITRASGKKKTVLARYVRNTRLADALHQQALGVPPSFRTADPLGSSLERMGSVVRENQELFA
jgi:transposase